MARFLSFTISVLALVIVILFTHPDPAPASVAGAAAQTQPAAASLFQLTQSRGCVRNSECASPLVCRASRCAVECFADRDCSAGAHCVIDHNGQGSCVLTQPSGPLPPDAPYCVSQRDCTSGACSRADDRCH